MSKNSVLPIIAILVLTPCVSAAKVTNVKITPSFETVGIIITLDQDPSTSQVGVEIKGPGQSTYKKAHPFVRFDARHMATSLFELQPGATYTVKIIDGASSTTHNFTTRPPYFVPQPLKVVNVSSRTQLVSALNAANPGDEIRIAAGSYTGGLTVTRSGTQANPIVISGEIPKAELSKPIELRTGLPVIQNASGEFGILVTASHVVIQHLRVRNNSGGGIQLDASSSCVVQHCQVYDNGEWNILVQHGGSSAGHNLIQRNHVADLQHSTPFNIETGGDNTVTYYGIKNDNFPGPGTVIRDNLIEQHYDGIVPCGNEAETQDVSESATDVLAKWPNHDVEVYDNRIVDQRDDAIEADGICVNARIYRNWLGRSGSPTSIAPALPGPYFFVRNMMTDFEHGAVKFNTAKGRGTIRNIYFYHNTIAKTDPDTNDSDNAALYLWDGTPSKLVTFRNNIFTTKHRCVIIQNDWTHKPDMDYDLWYSPHGPNAELFSWWGNWKVGWSDWKANSGNEAHGVWGDPQLDAKLEIPAGSPAIDKGQPIPGINDLFGGAGPDIGAFELGKPTPPPADGGPVKMDGGTVGDSGQPPGDSTVVYNEAGVAGDSGGGDGDSDGCGCTLERVRSRSAATAGLLLLLVIGLGALLRTRSRAQRP